MATQIVKCKPIKLRVVVENLLNKIFIKNLQSLGIMKLTCPECDNPIPMANINVEKDVAICPRCEEAYSISDLVDEGQGLEDFNITESPLGTWYQDSGIEWEIGASTRSWSALFLVPFTCVWAGGSLTGIFGAMINAGKVDPFGMLFAVPFVIGSIVLIVISCMTVAGKVVVTVSGNEGSIFTGIGPIGWRRKFDWSEVKLVEENNAEFLGMQNQNGVVVSLIGKKRRDLGSMLTTERREYVAQALRKKLSERASRT
ncbi:MAG: hypothetical protein ACO1RA_08775 [Planctomycetaceae bacterium]